MKTRVSVFGNCQAAEVERILATHAPFVDRFALVPIKAVFLMTETERAEFVELAKTLDVLICQHTGQYYAPADTANLRKNVSGEVIELPSLWFGGHLPDMTYFNGSVGSPSDYHSVIIASAFYSGLSEDDAAALFDSRESIDRTFLEANYEAGIVELQRRERGCVATISDLIRSSGPSCRLFHTMNHPNKAVILHVTNQLLDYLDVPRVHAPKVDRLASIEWPVTGAVARMFGVARAQKFLFDHVTSTLQDLIADYYDYYRKFPSVLATNKGLLNPDWLKI